jgi:Ser/Thr protein kinase RdoA (MazF antagonist)
MLWRFVAEGEALRRVARTEQAGAAGRAFGELQRVLADYPLPLAEPIPGFLRLPHYLEELDTTLQRVATDRATDAALEVVAARRTPLGRLFPGGGSVIHGDCKVDNLLFDAVDAVVCILDLDTVMRGHWALDFGDLARSAAADGSRFRVDLFAAAARGFLRSGAAPYDADALLMAPRHVALMLGVRFLTDHLRGDEYFKVTARGDNLRRAEEQFALLTNMEAKEGALLAALPSEATG